MSDIKEEKFFFKNKKNKRNVNGGNIMEANLVGLLSYVLGVEVGEAVKLPQEGEENHSLVLLGFNGSL